ncbi:MAG: alkaline phosphatase family protein [Acidobacteria bacterium]|nr:alkaline phosphatase family protein [Acidobacteriota bacterium]
MRRTWRSIAVFVLALSLWAAPPAAPVKPSKPKLVLLVVVDQFRYDYLTRFRAHYTAGLARLLERGAVFTNAHLEHVPTVTAIGHSITLTGATPAVSGIAGNEWFDRESGKQVTSVTDDSTALLGAPGQGASPRRLLVTTVGDELKIATRGRARVYGISIKDRAAILPVGHMADGAFWFDAATGNFVGSTYYFPQLPAWAGEFNQSRAADQFLGREWMPIVKDFGPAVLKPFRKLPATPGKDYYDGLERTPWGNDIVVMLAERAIEGAKLGRGEATDLLSVSFSSNDRVGHLVGPDADDVRDLSAQTDRTLGRFLQFVDAKVGLDKTLVVFTADHGIAPLPEFAAQNKLPGGRLAAKTALDAIEKSLVVRYGEGKWVAGGSGSAPYFDYELIRRKGLDLAEVEDVAATAVRRLPHIARVYTGEQIRTGRLFGDLVAQRVANGYYDGRSPDLVIVPEPNWFFGTSGASHGAPFNYDTQIPVVFMGPGVRPGVYHQRIAALDIAPTVATILEVATPSGAAGRALAEIIR